MTYEFYTTGNDVGEFRSFGQRAFCKPMDSVSHVDLPTVWAI